VHNYISSTANTESLLAVGPIVVICLQLAVTHVTQKLDGFTAIILGTLISGLAWVLLIIAPSVPMVVATLVVVALGEITQTPRYYEYVSRLAPSGQQGTYMGFAFMPLGIGAFVSGWFGGTLMHHFGEVAHRPERIWWAISGVGVATAALLWIYDKTIRKSVASEV